MGNYKIYTPFAAVFPCLTPNVNLVDAILVMWAILKWSIATELGIVFNLEI